MPSSTARRPLNVATALSKARVNKRLHFRFNPFGGFLAPVGHP